MQFNRLQELEVDFDLILMIGNAGFNLKACVVNLSFHHFTLGKFYETQKDQTHPGFKERINKNIEFLDYHMENSKKRKKEKTNCAWEYFRNGNVLIFSPKKKD